MHEYGRGYHTGQLVARPLHARKRVTHASWTLAQSDRRALYRGDGDGHGERCLGAHAGELAGPTDQVLSI